MHRKHFIQSLAAVIALQAIPASVLPQDINHIQAQITQPVRLHDVLITPEGEASTIVWLCKSDHVFAKPCGGRDTDITILTTQQAQVMRCTDWDDLDQ
jgi:hypothetical protein